jgi:hypothetical protein
MYSFLPFYSPHAIPSQFSPLTVRQGTNLILIILVVNAQHKSPLSDYFPTCTSSWSGKALGKYPVGLG